MAAAARHLEPGRQRLKVRRQLSAPVGSLQRDLLQRAKCLIVLQSLASATELLGPVAGPRYLRIRSQRPLWGRFAFGGQKAPWTALRLLTAALYDSYRPQPAIDLPQRYVGNEPIADVGVGLERLTYSQSLAFTRELTPQHPTRRAIYATALHSAVMPLEFHPILGAIVVGMPEALA